MFVSDASSLEHYVCTVIRGPGYTLFSTCVNEGQWMNRLLDCICSLDILVFSSGTLVAYHINPDYSSESEKITSSRGVSVYWQSSTEF
jgi:hypothetical protein